MSALILHAKRELLALGYLPLDQAQEEGPNKWIQENLLQLLEAFAAQWHSGMSAAYLIHAFSKLAAFEPLSPLTGAEEEWMEVGEGVWQNRRCPRVVKQNDRFDGQAYDLDGTVFEAPDGSRYTNRNSMTPISFPYTPVTVYVKEGGDSDIPQ